MSIFAGALSDKWNKKVTMLVRDSFAALCTVGVWLLFRMGRLEVWHLYCLNALNGLMNTIQQPAAKKGLDYLKENRGIPDLIFFLAAINLIASFYRSKEEFHCPAISFRYVSTAF